MTSENTRSAGARDTTHGAIVKVRNADPVASTELAERFVAGLGRLSL
jgi:hypothetical protein